MLERVVVILEAHERDEPWAMGCTSLALARALRVSEAELIAALAPALAAGALAYRAGYYARAAFTPHLTDEQRTFFDAFVPQESVPALQPAPYDDVVAAMHRAPVPGLAHALDTMTALGEVERIGRYLYRRKQLDAIVAQARALPAERGRFTAAEFRDAIGLSRKYAVPLLEWLDARGITLRRGDFRSLAEPDAS